MGRIKWSVRFSAPKKFEERRSVGITKRPCYTFRRLHLLEWAKKQKRTKEQWMKKKNSLDKPKQDEVKKMVVDAGSKEGSLAQQAWEGNGRDKLKAGEVNKVVVDAGSKEEGMAQPAQWKRRNKLVTQEVVDFYVGLEIVDYMLCKPLETVPNDTITEIFLRPEYDVSISALLKESIEEDADMLRQYRTNKRTPSSKPKNKQPWSTDEEARLVSPRELMLA